jgi:hypothetical protein
MRQILIITLIAITLAACADTTSSRRYEEAPYYVINGKLTAGEPLTLSAPVFVGKTVSTDGSNLNDMVIADAEVFIRDVTDNPNGPIDSLTFDIAIGSDDVTMGYFDPDSTLIPQCGHTYRIVAIIPGVEDSVWAETTVPKLMTVLPDPAFTTDPNGEYPSIPWETSDSQHPLRAQLTTGDQFNLFVQFYCLEESYEDVEWTITFGSSDKPADQDEYEDPASHEPRKIEFFYRSEPEAQDDGYFIRESRFKTFVWFYGRYRIKYYSIDDNYYNYLYNSEGFKHGGVHNGLGYFGSASGNTLYTRFTR